MRPMNNLRFLADENFNELIVVGLLRRLPALNVLTLREAGLAGVDDPSVLAWAAIQGRIVLTHDVQTMAKYAYEREVCL